MFQSNNFFFKVHRGTSEKYRAALRSRVFNLRDKKNPALRENVLIGAVSPEKWVFFELPEREYFLHHYILFQKKVFRFHVIRRITQDNTEYHQRKGYKCWKFCNNFRTYVPFALWDTQFSEIFLTFWPFSKQCFLSMSTAFALIKSRSWNFSFRF